MLALMMLSSIAALVFVYIFMPALWASLMASDEALDAHEAGLAVVAMRNPFRESGPPANMAKLILLRHKIQTTNRKRRGSPRTRQVPRITSQPPRPKAAWIHVGRPFGGKANH